MSSPAFAVDPFQLRRAVPRSCEELLAEQHVGRVAWNAADGPEVLPVNYAWHVGQVVFRTVPYGAMAALARRTPVAFEVDHIDEQERAGWSVVVRGFAEAVRHDQQIVRLGPPTSSCRGPSGVGHCSSPSRHAPSAVGAFRPGSGAGPIQDGRVQVETSRRLRARVARRSDEPVEGTATMGQRAWLRQ